MSRLPGWSQIDTLARGQDWLEWSWASFWPELAAGLVTFGLGIPLAYFFLRHETALSRRRQFEEFQVLATEVRRDFIDVATLVDAWSSLIERRQQILPIEERSLTWEMDEFNLRSLFASYGVQHTTHLAVTRYRALIEVAKEWNTGLAANDLSPDTERKAKYRVAAASATLKQAIGRLEKVGKLKPAGV